MTEDIKRLDIKDVSFLSQGDDFSMSTMSGLATHYNDEGVHVSPQRHEKTLTFIKYALLLDAIDEGWLYEQKGWMYNQLHRYREALSAFERARHLGYANDGWLYEQKSYALDKLERDEEALEAFERARRLGYANEE
jgi:tetratricopeptide (TPR) repeat protein